jgi:hypothetical protein
VRWFLWVRKPKGTKDEFIDEPLAHLKRLEDKPEAERIAETFRKARAKGLKEPKAETKEDKEEDERERQALESSEAAALLSARPSQSKRAGSTRGQSSRACVPRNCTGSTGPTFATP